MAIAIYPETYAPTVVTKSGRITYCKHVAVEVLSNEVEGKSWIERIEAFVQKYPMKDLIKRLFRGLDIMIAGDWERLEDGAILVGPNKHRVKDHICDCPDWVNGNTVYVREAMKAGTLPPPPVE